MSLRSWVHLALSIGLLALAGSASAEPAATDFSRRGFYIGLDAIYANGVYNSAGVPGSAYGSAGLNTRVGYRLRSWLAAELFYEWTRLHLALDKPNAGLSADTHTITGNLKFILSPKRAQPYLLFGVGVEGLVGAEGPAARDASEWGVALRPALGVDLYITRNLVANAEFGPTIRLFDAATESAIQLSVSTGLQFRF